jgi:hypothetical protein
MILPLLALAVFGAWRWYENQTPGVMTNERKAVYHFAMREERDPQKIAYWADWFDKQGLDGPAENLRNRIKIPAINGEGRAVRQRLVRKALSSDNVAGIHGLAEIYECQGYGSTAQLLRDYASGLNYAAQVPECPLNTDLYDNPMGFPSFGSSNSSGEPTAFGVPIDFEKGCQCGHKPEDHTPNVGAPTYRCTKCNCKLFLWAQKCGPNDIKIQFPSFGQDGPPPPVFTYIPNGDDINLSRQSTQDYQAGNTLVVSHVQQYAARCVAETGRDCVVFADDGSTVVYESRMNKV